MIFEYFFTKSLVHCNNHYKSLDLPRGKRHCFDYHTADASPCWSTSHQPVHHAVQ